MVLVVIKVIMNAVAATIATNVNCMSFALFILIVCIEKQKRNADLKSMAIFVIISAVKI